MSQKGFGRRVNAWLDEGPGEIFRDGKWRFWFPVVVGFTLINAALTALVFSDAGRLQNAMGAVLVGVGGLVAWLCVGALHYSDSPDRRLAIGVSALDSVVLLFVVGHFSFLLWTYGHLKTLQNAEAQYYAKAEAYNAKAEKISEDNAKISANAERIEIERTRRARIENDTVYQARKAAEKGAKVHTGSSAGGIAASLSTAPIELEKPKAPAESSVAFLTKWDAWIRVLNFGELALAVVTLIFIRNRSAAVNSPAGGEELFRPGRDVRSSAPLPTPAFSNDTVSLKRDDTDNRQKTTRVVNKEGLRRLREALKLIAFDHGPTHFKTDPKPEIGAVWVRQYKSSHGVAREVAACRAKISILDDAMRMDRTAFRERLEKFLRENGFEI